MYAYLLICGDMYWRTTFSFLYFITDNVMLDFKCTSIWNIGFLWRLHVALINKVYHCWKTGTYPCGTSSVIMRSDLLSNHLDVIGNLHHAFVVHWRFSIMLSSAYRSLFLVWLKILRLLFIFSLFDFSRKHSLHSSDIEFRLMDVADDIMTHVVICLVYWNR